MAGEPDDDVPTIVSAELAAATAAERGALEAAPAPAVDASAKAASSPASARKPPSGRPAPPSIVRIRPSSSHATAKATPPRGAPESSQTSEEDSEEDSITATSPRVAGAGLAIGVPHGVEIRTKGGRDLGDDDDDYVETVTASSDSLLIAAERAAALRRADAAAADDDEDEDDSPTRQSLAPEVEKVARAVAAAAVPATDDEDDEREPTAVDLRGGAKPDLIPSSENEPIDRGGPDHTQPGVDSERASAAELPTNPGLSEDVVRALGPSVATKTTGGDVARAQRGSLAGLEVLDTSDEIPTMERILPPEDGDATTKKKSSPVDSPADAEQVSITAQTPNMQDVLQAHAAEAAVPVEVEDEDQLPQNKTAVMAQAPLRPPLSASGLAAPPRPPSGSASAIHVTPVEPLHGDKASFGALFAAAPAAHPQESLDALHASGPTHAAAAEPGFPSPPFLSERDSLRPPAPRYGLLVGVVAVISVVVPVSLYVYLNRPSDDPATPRPASHAVPDFVGRGEATRSKATPKAASTVKRSPLRR